MVKALVFISVEPNKLSQVALKVKEVPGVKKVYEVTGEYDLVAEVETKDYNEISQLLKEKILQIPGILHTVTSFIIAEY